MEILPIRNADQAYPTPRLTVWGYAAILLYAVLPFLGALALGDLLLYLLFRYGFGLCYALYCYL
jgi:hypothetical protein